MNVHATVDPKWSGLTSPNGKPLHLNTQDFVAIDRDRDALISGDLSPAGSL